MSLTKYSKTKNTSFLKIPWIFCKNGSIKRWVLTDSLASFLQTSIWKWKESCLKHLQHAKKKVKNIHLCLNNEDTIWSIKKYATEIDDYNTVKVLQNLKGKMHTANKFGLTSLLRTCAQWPNAHEPNSSQ